MQSNGDPFLKDFDGTLGNAIEDKYWLLPMRCAHSCLSSS
jgi:hypothetical protein